MPSGTIARLLIDKGFGFIRDESGIEHFFHRSSVRGAVFELLREGQRVLMVRLRWWSLLGVVDRVVCTVGFPPIKKNKLYKYSVFSILIVLKINFFKIVRLLYQINNLFDIFF